MLVWNRVITDTDPGPIFEADTFLPDHDLTLYATEDFLPTREMDASHSAQDNVEHIFLYKVGTGQFALSVTSTTGGAYALAWRSSQVIQPRISKVEVIDQTHTRITAAVEPGSAYQLASNEGSSTWNTLAESTALDATLEVQIIERLQELISQAKEQKALADDATVKRSERQGALDEAAAAVTKALDTLEARFVGLTSFLPKPLTDILGAEIELMRDGAKKAKAGSTGRTKNLLAALIKVEKFNNKITETPLTVELPNGKQQQVDTVFFGLSIAYAINQSGDRALVGKPTSTGWKFTEHNDHADAIRRLVEVSRGEGEIEFVELPAQVSKPVSN